MDLPEKDINYYEFLEGFNDAEILAEHFPAMLFEIEPEYCPYSDYFDGFFEGKEYSIEQKLSDEREVLEELDGLRNRSKDRDLEREQQ